MIFNEFKKRKLICLFCVLGFISVCSGNLIRPLPNQNLNYVNVIFEWEQEPKTKHYQIQLVDVGSDSIIVFDSIKTTVFVAKAGIEWDRAYEWKIRPFLENDTYGDWVGASRFNIIESKLGNVTINIHDESLMQPGLTMFGGPNPNRHTIVIDKNGKEIWNDAGYRFKINHVDEFGALYGNSDHSYPNFTACKIDYDMSFLWNSGLKVDPHDMKETPNKTYFTLKNVQSTGPIPSNNSWTEQFRALGFVADDTTNEFPWYAQRILEMDRAGNVIWSWNPFDYFSMDDFDNHGHTWQDAYINMEYDWTHSNALFHDVNESAIYLSSRHLSRITKIDYPSGEVIYNISLPSPFIALGESYIGNDLLFNFQHHIERLENGNYTLFDNGNISHYIFDHGLRISRAIEFEVIGDSACNMIWEHSLPPNLFGHAGGSVKVLENNNRLIYTRGNGAGTQEPSILEVTIDHELVWKMTGTSNYAWYRAFRIPSLHPDAYSIMIQPFSQITTSDTTFNGIMISDEENMVVSIMNESDYGQPYDYFISDKRNWIEQKKGTVVIDAKDRFDIDLTFLPDSKRNTAYSEISVVVIPLKHEYAKKHKKYLLFDDGNANMEGNHNAANVTQNVQNRPNPFNPKSNLEYELLRDGYVSVRIYDLVGRKVKDIFEGHQIAGTQSFTWDATSNNGSEVATGIYFYVIETANVIIRNKMLFLK